MDYWRMEQKMAPKQGRDNTTQSILNQQAHQVYLDKYIHTDILTYIVASLFRNILTLFPNVLYYLHNRGLARLLDSGQSTNH